jgi:UV DNA damage repair endonuclease
MSSNFNCSYMARSSLTYIPCFFYEIFLSADIYRLCKWTQFWKGAIQESSQQSLIEIGSVVSEEKIFCLFHPPFFLICIIGQNRQKFKVHKKSCHKLGIFDKRSHLNLLLWNRWTKLNQTWQGWSLGGFKFHPPFF